MRRTSRSIIATICTATGILLGAAPNAALAAPQQPSSRTPSVFAHDGSGRDGPSRSHRSTGNGSKRVRVFGAPNCPVGLSCGVAETAYTLLDPNDFTSYCNYDQASRPSADLPITGATLHTTEGDLASVLALYADPASCVSANFVIPSDGESQYDIITTVPPANIAWTDGNWSSNTSHITVEMVGFSTSGVTARQLEVAAKLVKFYGSAYGFPADAKHVIGHNNVAAHKNSAILTMHTDPGPFFNWERFFRLTGYPVLAGGSVHVGSAVTVVPKWDYNRQIVTGCTEPDHCVTATTPQKSNFVYLRTEPSASAPLISNPVVTQLGGNGAGSTEVANNAARAFYGQTFVVTAMQGTWVQVLFNGQFGWVNNPAGCHRTLVAASGAHVVTLKDGVTSTAVYGRAIPELSEYPAELTGNPLVPSYSIPTPTPLAYVLTSGQKYATVEPPVQASHYYTWSIGGELPKLTVFGQTPYVQIQLGDRRGYVKATDVNIS